MTLRKPATAQELCDRERRKKPHLIFFIGDPPCWHCRRAFNKQKREREEKKS